MKILVVDDSKIARVYIIKSIKSLGIDAQIVEAVNGQEAVDAYKSGDVNAVFLDLTMPVMDGYEALCHIISLDADAQVIVVSADVQPEAKLRVLKSGAKNMYAKPIDEDKMRQIFEKDLVI